MDIHVINVTGFGNCHKSHLVLTLPHEEELEFLIELIRI